MKLKEHIDYLQKVLLIQGDIDVTFGGTSTPIIKIVSSADSDPLSVTSIKKALDILPGNPINRRYDA